MEKDIEYLERIIKYLEEQIRQKDDYIHILLKSQKKGDKTKTIHSCIFEHIDNKFKLYAKPYEELESVYPYNDCVYNILYNLIDSDECVVNILNKSTIQYKNRTNDIIKMSINDFSKKICTYVFDLLKPICEIKQSNIQIDDEDNQSLDDNRIQNLLLFKDEKICINAIKKLFRLN